MRNPILVCLLMLVNLPTASSMVDTLSLSKGVDMTAMNRPCSLSSTHMCRDCSPRAGVSWVMAYRPGQPEA